jgi:hypothetical protein
MTRQHPISRLADGRTRGVALGLALAALALLGAVAAGSAAAQPDQPTVRVVDSTTTADGTTTADVVLTSAPDGLSGFYLDVSVRDPDVARIESASYPDRFGMTSDPKLRSEGQSVVLEAADIDGTVDPGASNVTIATITVVGVASGEAELVVDPRQFDDDEGSALEPATRAGAVTVTAADAQTDPGSTGQQSTDSAPATTPAATTHSANGSLLGSDPLSVLLVVAVAGATLAVGYWRRPGA